MKSLTCTIITWAALFIGQRAVAAEKDEIVATCRDGYLQAKSAIQTLSCSVEMNISPSRGPNPFSGKIEEIPASVQRLRFAEDHGVARGTLTIDPPGNSEDYLWGNGRLKLLETKSSRGGKIYFGRFNGAEAIRGLTTAWHMALMDLSEDIQQQLTEGKVKEAVLDEIQGQKCYRLSVYTDGWRRDIWFDISKNFLIRKTVFYHMGDAGPPNQINEVVKFIEAKPGIFFPVSVKATSGIEGPSQLHVTTAFRDVKINEPIDSAQLELRFPPGTKVTDTRKGTYYVVDGNEQPVGEVETIASTPRSDMQLPTALEVKSYRIYWAAGAIVVGIIGVFLAVYWRRRSHVA